MPAKVLKPYTIIPSNLYVQRDADRQLFDIIEDMGRPGYVLVSRQMGKTNLLLNAKRRLESRDDAFIYIDLSNPFKDAKSCFENIIDTALDANSEHFGKVASQVRELRKVASDVPAHKQHTNELRVLLKNIKGKIVVILDEIDALTKTDYSDAIFAQIRSIYFSRVNFPELERLTYILSGVVEPIDIIKDPKISPFNIGQKIYLNDFSKAEFVQFLTNSSLSLDISISDRVYFWTNGNPRMTWDICSEIETIQANQTISTRDVDAIVSKLYLTNFDKPPIDNIRELVKTDRDIRGAIVEISYGKVKEISDKVKSRLYLSGIINFHNGEIAIKNEIIKAALNVDWIRTVETETRGLLRHAIDAYESGKYQECIESFESFLDGNDFAPDDKALCFLYLGEAYYRVQQYDSALDKLVKAEFDREDQAKLYYRTLNLKGTVLYHLNRIAESLAVLREVIDSGRKDVEYARALINYGATLLKSPIEGQMEEAVNVFNDIISEKGLNREKLLPEFVTELKSIAYTYLGRIQVATGKPDNAKENYKRALEQCRSQEKPGLLLALYDISDSTEQNGLLSDLVNLIAREKLSPISDDIEHPNAYGPNDLNYVTFLAFLKYDIEDFLTIVADLSISTSQPLARVVYDSILFVITVKRLDAIIFEALRKLYNAIVSNQLDFDTSTKMEVVKFLAYFEQDNNYVRPLLLEYIELFRHIEASAVDFVDIRLFEQIILNLIENGDYGVALDTIRLIKSYRHIISDPKIMTHYFVINNLELSIHSKTGNSSKLAEVSSEIIDMANERKWFLEAKRWLGQSNFKTILDNARYFASRRPTTVSASKPQYGRNDKITVKYENGILKTGKFKVLERDIISGLCKVVTN